MARARSLVERSAEGDKRLLARAGLELGDELVQVRGYPGGEIRQRDGLTLLGVGDKVRQPRSRQPARVGRSGTSE